MDSLPITRYWLHGAEKATGGYHLPCWRHQRCACPGDLVTMNVPTEMAYARQLNMNYSTLIAISNPAEGLGTWDWKTLSDLYPRLHAQSIEIYLAAVRRIHHLPERRRIGDTLRVHPDFGPILPSEQEMQQKQHS